MPEGYNGSENDCLIHPAFRVPLSHGDSGHGLYRQSNESESRLLSHVQTPARTDVVNPLDRWHSSGYGPVQQQEEEDLSTYTSYEPYRVQR